MKGIPHRISASVHGASIAIYCSTCGRSSKLARFFVAVLHCLFVSTSCSYHSGTFGIIHSQEGITCQFRTQQGKSSIAEQDQAGCVLKGIALHAASILHLGIYSQSLNSHLLPTRTLSSYCSFSLACSIVLSFAIALLRWFFMQISCFLRSGTFGTIHSQAHLMSIPHTAGQIKHGKGGPTVFM